MADFTWFKLPKTTVKGHQIATTGKARAKLGGPDLKEFDDAWVLWVMTAASQRYDQSRWVAYVVDADPVKVLRAVHGKLSVKVELLDSEGQKITGEEFDLAEGVYGDLWLGYVSQRRRTGTPYMTGSGYAGLLKGASFAKVTATGSFNAYLGPMLFGQFNSFVPGGDYTYAAQRMYRRQYTMTKDEFKRLGSIRCTLVFKKTKPKE